MKLPGGNRDRKPRLKPGITFTRLFIFLVAVVVFAVAAERFASGTYPSGDCGAKEIDTKARRQGTCMEGKTKLVVVDRHSTLRLASLEARILGIDQRKTIKDAAGSKTAAGEFAVFDLAITNRTDTPTSVTRGQVMLLIGRGLHAEAVEAEEAFEPRSFLRRRREIPPRGTEEGTVIFAVPPKQVAHWRAAGNLDLVNFGSSVPALEPEALFSEPEYGVIRTYK